MLEVVLAFPWIVVISASVLACVFAAVVVFLTRKLD